MSWFKPFIDKYFLKLFRTNISLIKNRLAFVFRWNQTQKITVGLLASIFSMMLLMSFFESLEEETSAKPSPSDAENLKPQLGATDDLLMQFGLDASLPVREPEVQITDASERNSTKAVIRTVSVQQTPGAAKNSSDIFHAVGLEFGQQNNQGRVQHIAGENPVYVSTSAHPDERTKAKDKQAAVWLTGEIEEVNDLPVDGSFRRYNHRR